MGHPKKRPFFSKTKKWAGQKKKGHKMGTKKNPFKKMGKKKKRQAKEKKMVKSKKMGKVVFLTVATPRSDIRLDRLIEYG